MWHCRWACCHLLQYNLLLWGKATKTHPNIRALIDSRPTEQLPNNLLMVLMTDDSQSFWNNGLVDTYLYTPSVSTQFIRPLIEGLF